MQQQTVSISSPWGAILVRTSSDGICGVSFAPETGEVETETTPLLADALNLFERYFRGEQVQWSIPMDLSGGSDFDRKVWTAIEEIPYGGIRTYKWVAEKIGKPGATRAVGSALARNPIPVIIPCHRVIRSDGGLGGFSGGIEWKVNLLALEGIKVGKRGNKYYNSRNGGKKDEKNNLNSVSIVNYLSNCSGS